VVGEYLDQNGFFHGFRWDKGRFTTFDGPLGTSASITDVNDRGDMVGVSAAADGTIRGFLLRKGVYTTFQALDLPFTFPFDINNRGQIAGTAGNADGTKLHGFLLAGGADGPVTQIDVPGVPATAAYGLDDRGRLVGVYDNPNVTPTAVRSSAAATPQPEALPLGLGDRRTRDDQPHRDTHRRTRRAPNNRYGLWRTAGVPNPQAIRPLAYPQGAGRGVATNRPTEAEASQLGPTGRGDRCRGPVRLRGRVGAASGCRVALEF
jgi:hypothetical protein